MARREEEPFREYTCGDELNDLLLTRVEMFIDRFSTRIGGCIPFTRHTPEHPLNWNETIGVYDTCLFYPGGRPRGLLLVVRRWEIETRLKHIQSNILYGSGLCSGP